MIILTISRLSEIPFILLIIACSLLIKCVPAENLVSLEDCFIKVEGQAISGGAKPLAKFYNISPYLCLRNCLAPELEERCATVIYHKHFSTCQLYDDEVSRNETLLVPAAGHNYFNRIMFDGVCRTGNFVSPAGIRLTPSEPKKAPPTMQFWRQFGSPVIKRKMIIKQQPEIVQPTSIYDDVKTSKEELAEFDSILKSKSDAQYES